jgi:diguanylate cyclase (GGDEF)-like protein
MNARMVIWTSAARRRARRLAPFAAAACLPYGLVVVPPTAWRMSELLLSAALTVGVGAAAVLIGGPRLPAWSQLLPALGYVLALGLLRHAGNGTSAGVGVLVMLPVFWVALYGSRPELAIVLVAALLSFVAPVVIVGAPLYPLAGVRGGILLTAVAGIIGVTVQGLIAQIRLHDRERTELIARLDGLAHSDPLTALPNRRAWSAALQRALLRAAHAGTALTVAVVDLDRFKAFNDAHGHDGGDGLLVDCAHAWRARLRRDDVLARLGGDEFAILLPCCDSEQAVRVLERLTAAVPDGQTCSIGVAEWDGEQVAAALMRQADVALYDAKGRGRALVATGRYTRGEPTARTSTRDSSPAKSDGLRV